MYTCWEEAKELATQCMRVLISVNYGLAYGVALGMEAASFFAFSQKRYSGQPDPKGNAQNILL